MKSLIKVESSVAKTIGWKINGEPDVTILTYFSILDSLKAGQTDIM